MHATDSAPDDALWAEVTDALELVRPVLEADGGACELVAIDEGIVVLRLLGACATCPASALTLKATIERVLKLEVPDVQGVRSLPSPGVTGEAPGGLGAGE